MRGLVDAVYDDIPEKLRGAAASNLRLVLLKVSLARRRGCARPVPLTDTVPRRLQLEGEGRAHCEGGDGLSQYWRVGGGPAACD